VGQDNDDKDQQRKTGYCTSPADASSNGRNGENDRRRFHRLTSEAKNADVIAGQIGARS
jgi:hypothetical protein